MIIIDNILVNGLKKEFAHKLVNVRIEKIYQPEKDLFVFNTWNNIVSNQRSQKLIISMNPNTYRACITSKDYKVTSQHSTFCLHLKKALESGTIISVKQ
ncbi:MAG: NFACT family protein, partial [Candidatus Sericytochromatia bacterium]|nr:NFACT family protein [Candidatus Sericytochromatia bacterium]